MANARFHWHPYATPPPPPHPGAAASPETAGPNSLLRQYPRGPVPACRERHARLHSVPLLAAPTATSPGGVTRRVVGDVPLWARPSRVHEPHESLSEHDRYLTGYPDSLGLGFPARVAFYSGILPASVVSDRPYTVLLMR